MRRNQTRLLLAGGLCGVLTLLLLVVLRTPPTPWKNPATDHRSSFVSTGPALRQDSWRILGPGGGGAQFIPSISPHDPNLVLVACDMSGGYISTDGGSSWRQFNLRARIHSFDFDPSDPKVIYAAGSQLWRSSDKGSKWEMVYPEPQTVMAAGFLGGDEAPAMFITKPPRDDAVHAFAVDPGDSFVLYLNVGMTLLVSRDHGESWKSVVTLPAAARRIYPDPRSPRAARRLYLIGTDWTAVWDSHQLLHAGRPQGASLISGSAAGFPEDGGEAVIYVITDFRDQDGLPAGGLLVSRDGCRTWQPAHQTLIAMRPNSRKLPKFVAVATSKTRPDVLYVSFAGLDLREGRVFGVAKSVNGGGTWNLVWKESGRSAANILDAWVSEAFGPDWGENPLSLGVYDPNPEIVYGTDYGRTMRSTDGGKTWMGVYSSRVKGGGYTSTGIDVTTCYGIHFDPFDGNRQFISYTDIGLFRSEDGGRSWQASGKGIPKSWRNTTYWVIFDPKVQGRMWASSSGTHDLPRLKMFRKGSPRAFQGGVSISHDGGKTWKPSNHGMPEAAVTHLLLDPESPAGQGVLYAAAMGYGVYKTTDGGASWTLKNNGLIGAEPRAFRMAFDSHGSVYLVAARQSGDGSYGNDRDGMLYRSTDQAERWERISLPEGVNGPTGIAIDPRDPKRLYVSTWARSSPGGAPPQKGGIWLSVDGGGSWRNVHAADQYVYDVTVAPRDANVLYAAGFQSSIWRSTDRGETWQRIRGFNFKAAHRVIPDPFNPDMIYVATYGSSIWHGPAAGDPAAPEDIISPPAARFSR